jgi:3D (Asp-Asp-Asp) domain-containing protein
MLRAVVFSAAFTLAFVPEGTAQKRTHRKSFRGIATAYSDGGITAKGNLTRPGTAAADPAFIPLGSKIRVSGAGAYSGVYTVTDTGRKVDGREVDLYIPNAREAKVFGRKPVRVTILETGDNLKNTPETASKVPRSELAPAQKDRVPRKR